MERKQSEGLTAGNRETEYKRYPDEPLNPRIVNPVLQGCTLVATIDHVPCTVQLSPVVADAYRKGALPLNTLANAVLAQSDRMNQMASRITTTIVLKPSFGRGASNNRPLKQHTEYERKITIEKNAERKQIDLLSEALNGASNANGYWLNASGKGYPKFHPRGVSVSPFNALFMALHSDKNGAGQIFSFIINEAKAMGMSVREHERGVPFLFYNWNRYVNRNNPEEIISRTAYLRLDEQDRKHYKGVHNREVRTLFNIDQTTLQDVDRPSYEAALRQYGGVAERGYTEATTGSCISASMIFC